MARILVVDDEKSIRLTVAAFLEGAGHAVLAAESVDEAIRLIDANPVDVVVTDVLLPRRGGLELLHHVRQARPHVQVILMTGEPNLVTASAAVRARAFEYLTKPVPKATLLDTVARAVMVKVREDEHDRLEAENRRYRDELERLVEERTRQLRESEERYRAVVEDQTELICRFRADGTFTFVNEVFCRFFGKSALELLGSKWQPMVVPEDLPHIEDRLRALSPENPVVAIGNRVYSGSGQVHWMQFANRGHFDAGGRLTGIQAVGRDVSERKRAEQEIERHRAELQAVYDHAPFPMCVLDTERKIVFANHAFAVYAGRPVEQLVAQVACGVLGCMNALDDPRGCGFGPKCEACALRRAILDTIETGRSHHDVEHTTAVSGQDERRDVTWLGATAPIPVAGRSLVLLALQDITEPRRVQEALRQSETAARARAEELLAARARLRGLSQRLVETQEAERQRLARELHDQVGQILTVLSFRLDMARGELDAAGRERLGPHLDESRRLLSEATKCVRTVMTELRPGVLDECGIVLALQWCADQFRGQTGLAVDVLTCELEGRLPPETEAALFRIVQEALMNVAKHAQATQVTVALETTPNGLRLTVADNGVGFDADPTRRHPRADGQGGWGLMTMSERALAVGAELRVESQPGKGTRVIVEISNQ